MSALYSALSGALAKQQTVNVLSNNMANVNTTGFKKDGTQFSSYLTNAHQTGPAEGTNYARTEATYTDYTQGSMERTENPLDLAIEGDGFFRVMGPDGGERYTRAGHFLRNANNNLVTPQGHPVMGVEGPIMLPPNERVSIAQDGTVWAGQAQVGQLDVVAFDNPQALEKAGENLYRPAEGQEPQAAAEARVRQGYLEGANVNMVKNMVELINSHRAYEAYNRVMKMAGESSAAELGRVG